jgi:hypothetical protein
LVGQDLENDEIGLELSKILRDSALPERIVERIVDQLRKIPNRDA